MAQGRERTKSHASQEAIDCAAALKARGIPVTLEKAVGTYNIDIALDELPIAVEIQGGGWHACGRHGARLGERRKYILGSGWHLMEIWARRSNCLCVESVADKVISLANSVRGLDAIPRQHWVLRGDGSTAPIAKSYGYNVS